MTTYIYPAVFEPYELEGYTVTFPDLPGCVTEGDSLEHALRMAAEAMSLYLFTLEEDGEPIPAPSSPALIQPQDDYEHGSFVTLVSIVMEPLREEIRNQAIRKTVTIPQWLFCEARNAGIDLSQILQEALKQRLGVIERP